MKNYEKNEIEKNGLAVWKEPNIFVGNYLVAAADFHTFEDDAAVAVLAI